MKHVSPWLHSVLVHDQHRAHVFCTFEDMVNIHYGVFMHAAHQQHKRKGTALDQILGVAMSLRPKSPISALKYTDKEVLW